MITRKYKLQKLLDGSDESLYWLGFLIGDGSFYSDGRLKVILSDKDEEHINSLICFLGCTINKTRRVVNGRNYVGISVMDVDTVWKLCDKYSIVHNKTYFPPNLTQCSRKELDIISIGLLDADGCVKKVTNREDLSISIKKHSSWLQLLKLLYPEAQTRINAAGYSFSSYTNSVNIKKLRTVADTYNIPYMPRKLGIVDLNKVSKQELADQRKINVKRLLTSGRSRKEIQQEIGMSRTALTQLIIRNKEWLTSS